MSSATHQMHVIQTQTLEHSKATLPRFHSAVFRQLSEMKTTCTHFTLMARSCSSNLITAAV